MRMLRRHSPSNSVVDLLDKRGRRIELVRLETFPGFQRPRQGPPPTVFRDTGSGLLRTIGRELVIRFQPRAYGKLRRDILKRHGLAIRRTNAFIPDQIVFYQPDKISIGEELVGISNELTQLEEVAMATPNFISEYRRQAPPFILPREWHLRDIDIAEAWKITTGKPEIVVAILDDGVDVDHPNLCCAGLVAARGLKGGSVGVAPGCRILPVKIFHADHLVPDERVADAIRYAARHADILSCSWTCGSARMFVWLSRMPARDEEGEDQRCSAPSGMTLEGRSASRPGTLTPSRWGPRRIRPDRRVIRTPGSSGLHTNSFGGTSAATPLAAGIGALVLSVCPSLTRDELKGLLEATADKICGPFDPRGHSNELGFGRVNAGKAVSEASK